MAFWRIALDAIMLSGNRLLTSWGIRSNEGANGQIKGVDRIGSTQPSHAETKHIVGTRRWRSIGWEFADGFTFVADPYRSRSKPALDLLLAYAEAAGTAPKLCVALL